MDFLNPITKLVDHERGKLFGLFAALMTFLGVNGCDVRTASLESGEAVTADQFEAEVIEQEGDLISWRATIDADLRKYNAAVEEMNLVAEQFNIQLRAYNAKRKN